MSNRVLLGNVKGDTGDVGATGPAGVNGENGITPRIENGIWWIGLENTGITAEGNKWITAQENPTTQGNDGDMFLNTLTYDVFKKINNQWVLQANIKGARGEQGIQGERGETALTFDVGDVQSVPSDAPASVRNVGSGKNIVLNFEIPKGENGQDGVSFEDAPVDDLLYGRRNGEWSAITDEKGTIIKVNGQNVESVSFRSNPQEQLDNKQIVNRIADDVPDFNWAGDGEGQIMYDVKNRKTYVYLYDGHSYSRWIDITPSANIVINNISVTSDMYTGDATYTDYLYKVNIPLEVINEYDVANVIFNIADSLSGNFAPICETYNGGIRLYAKEIVETTIPTISVITSYIGGGL